MNEIIKQIDQRIVLSGEHLPSERQLAIEVGVNRSTIVKAYEELNSLDFVEKKRNSRTYVLSKSDMPLLFPSKSTFCRIQLK